MENLGHRRGSARPGFLFWPGAGVWNTMRTRGMGRMTTIRMAAWVLVLGALAAAARAQEQEASEAAPARAPVVVEGRVRGRVRGLAGRPAEERAAAIEERIVVAARDASLDPAQVHVEESG